MRGGMIGIVAASLLARTTLAEVGSKIHDSRYHVLCYLSNTNKVFILSMLPRRSNGRVRERKQRGRAHCVALQGFKSYRMRREGAASRTGGG